MTKRNSPFSQINKIDTTVKNKQDNHNEFLKYCTGPTHTAA